MLALGLIGGPHLPDHGGSEADPPYGTSKIRQFNVRQKQLAYDADLKYRSSGESQEHFQARLLKPVPSNLLDERVLLSGVKGRVVDQTLTCRLTQEARDTIQGGFVMPWYERVAIGLAGGVCLACVRLVRNAFELDINFDLLLTALLAAVPLSIISVATVCCFRSLKSTKDVFIRALLAPSMVVSFAAGGGGEGDALGIGDRGLEDGSAVYGWHPGTVVRDLVGIFVPGTVQAQPPPDSAEVVPAPAPEIPAAAIKQIARKELESSAWNKTLRFLGVGKEPTNWICVVRQVSDSTVTGRVLHEIASVVDTSRLGLHWILPEGKSDYLLVAGGFGSRIQTEERRRRLEQVVDSLPSMPTDSAGMAAVRSLCEARLMSGQEIFSR